MQRSQLLHKIKQLEQETAGPERRQAAKARQGLLKEVQQGLLEAGDSLQDKVAYMEGIFAKQVLRVPNYCSTFCMFHLQSHRNATGCISSCR